jgi:hypothetical protein
MDHLAIDKPRPCIPTPLATTTACPGGNRNYALMHSTYGAVRRACASVSGRGSHPVRVAAAVRPFGAIQCSHSEQTGSEAPIRDQGIARERTTDEFDRLPAAVAFLPLAQRQRVRRCSPSPSSTPTKQSTHAASLSPGLGLVRRDWPGSPNLQAAAASRRRRGEEDGQIARNVVRFSGRRHGPAGHDKRKRQSEAKQACTRPRPAVVSSERARRKNRGCRARDGEVASSCRFPVTLKVWMVHAPVRFRLAYYGRSAFLSVMGMG